jgi:hypothetical protein
MTEAMPSHPEPPAERSTATDPSGPNPARRAQFLATEHWSLLATRSMSWNESFARTGMFLTSLSTATVSLALVGSATDFGSEFVVFALVVLSITLFLGVATFVRLSQVNNEDLYWVAGMNRLRGQYAKLEPGIEDEFVAGISLDTEGFAQTYGAMNVTGFSVLHVFVTTPGVIAVVCSAIAAVLAALVALQVTPAMASAIPVGLVVGVVSAALFIIYARRDAAGYMARMIRFQHSRDATAERRRRGGGR